MPFIHINDIDLHYQSIRAFRGKPTMVFSNSLGTDFRIWQDVIALLEGEVGVVAYDKRGHGLSEATPAPYSIDDHVGDLAGLLDYLGVSNAVVCGLSVGGIIAQGLYQARPDLVQALILSDTGYKVGAPELWKTRIEQAEKGGLEPMADAIMERWFSEEFRLSKKAELTGYRNMLVQQSVAGYSGTTAVLRDVDFTETVGQIAVPTLCIVGDQDLATPPELVKSLSERIPGAQYEIVAGAGHLPCVEKPYEFVTLVREFLANLTDETIYD